MAHDFGQHEPVFLARCEEEGLDPQSADFGSFTLEARLAFGWGLAAAGCDPRFLAPPQCAPKPVTREGIDAAWDAYLQENGLTPPNLSTIAADHRRWFAYGAIAGGIPAEEISDHTPARPSP